MKIGQSEYWMLVTGWYFRFFSRKLSDKDVKEVPDKGRVGMNKITL